MTEFTRRRLVGLAAAGVGITAGMASGITAAAQTPAPANGDWFAQAVESKRKAAVELAAVDVGIAVEPAFEFKA